MDQDLRASMTGWLENFLSLFRAEIKELSELEEVRISNLDDFSAPC